MDPTCFAIGPLQPGETSPAVGAILCGAHRPAVSCITASVSATAPRSKAGWPRIARKAQQAPAPSPREYGFCQIAFKGDRWSHLPDKSKLQVQ